MASETEIGKSAMKVFQMNDCDWYVADTMEAAIQQCCEDSGLPRDEAIDDPQELSDADLDRTIFVDEETGKRTFRAELDRLVAQGIHRPCLFASTEY